MEAAKLLGSKTHHIPGKLSVSELFFEVPTDHAKPKGGNLQLFARSVERLEKPVDVAKKEVKQPPWLCYLQGGPGLPCPAPQEYAFTNVLVEKGYKLLFLDQRGTGLSSTVTAQTLAEQGNASKQAAYLRLFRADSIGKSARDIQEDAWLTVSIVKDCELIRKTLTAEYPEENKKWSILGQSFGGFCCVNYLSRCPEGLREVFTAGGLLPLVKQPDPVYEMTYKKLRTRNEAYYVKYPEDTENVKHLAAYLADKEIKLPSGGTFSVLRLRQLGMYFGFHGTMDGVHDIILRCCHDISQFGYLTRSTLIAFDAMLPFDSYPLYAVIHETCYARGPATNWSADRMSQRFPEFADGSENGDGPIYFFGEMTFKQMYDDYAELRGLKMVAEILAQVKDWEDPYDEEQLARNEVPVYSSTYLEDMYVSFDYARETASKIKNCKHFVTNVLYHDALTKKSDEVVKQLFALRDDVMD